MKELIKKAGKVGLTLAIIAGGSAALIGVVNAIASPIIAKNDFAKTNANLVKVFHDYEPSKQSFDVEFELKEGDTNEYTYVTAIWNAKADGVDIGKIFKTKGSNSYGDVSLLIGIREGKFFSMFELLNTESYGQTLKSEYMDKVNVGTLDYTEVKCGATYGATLIKNMIEEAVNLASGVSPDVLAKQRENMLKVFPEADSESATFDKIKVTQEFKYVSDVYVAKNGSDELGYIYKAKANVIDNWNLGEMKDCGSMELMIGIRDVKLYNIVVSDNQLSYGEQFESGYITDVNAGSRDYSDVTCGTTVAATYVKEIVDESLDHAKKYQIENLAKVFKDGNADSAESIDITGIESQYIKELHSVKCGEEELGLAYKLSGKGFYCEYEGAVQKPATLSLLVGINKSGVTGIVVLDETFTYSKEFQNGYVDKVNDGSRDYTDIMDTGATFTADFAKKMIDAAIKDYSERRA